MFSKSRTFLLSFLFGVVLTTVVVVIVIPWIANQRAQTEISRLDAVTQIKNILRLGMIEMRISQIYEIKKDTLRVYRIPIPWTGQRSIIAVRGAADIGFDLERAEITPDMNKRMIAVCLPEPSVLSLDLDFHFISENDTFLNRLTPEDRNTILASLKTQVRTEIMTPDLAKRSWQRVDDLTKQFETLYPFRIRQACTQNSIG